MAFWNLFKKKKEEPPEIKKMTKEELMNWLKNKKTEIKQDQKQFNQKIKERISKLTQELKQEIIILNQVDFEKKKEQERIKSIVKENFNNYVINLERLVPKLQEIEEPHIINKINTTIHDFETKSKTNYAKATYLIGKELAATKESIGKFFKDIENIIKDHQTHIEESQIIESIETQINKYEESKKPKTKIIKEIEEQNQRIKEIKETLQKTETKIENIKKSEVYLENEKKKQTIKTKKQEQEQNISNLKQLINFKSLANFYHKYEKEMNIIKEYKENFRQTFKRTKGENIIPLLKESKLHTENISNQIKKINNIEQEIKELKIEPNQLENQENTILKLKHEKTSLQSNNEIKERTLNKFKENEKDSLSSLKQKLKEANIQLN